MNHSSPPITPPLFDPQHLHRQQVQALRTNRSGLHEAHYVYFWALYDIALDLAHVSPEEAVVVFSELVRLIETYKDVTPAVHHEHVMLWDRLGQVQVKSGDVRGSHASFARAHAHSVLACSAEAPLSAKLCGFRPSCLQDLLTHYGA